MIAYRIQEEAFGGLDRETVKLLDRLARGEKPNELNRRLKARHRPGPRIQGRAAYRHHRARRLLWRDTTYSSLSIIAQSHHRHEMERSALLRLARSQRTEGRRDAQGRHTPQNTKPPRRNRSSVRASQTVGTRGARHG